MFESFFPRPRFFFVSLILWVAIAMIVWYAGGRDFGQHFGLGPAPSQIIGISIFWSGPFLWFYIYYAAVAAIFCAFWQSVAPCRWWRWSLLGSALILFVTYVQVEVSVAINAWYGPFYNLIQTALTHAGSVTLAQFYGQWLTFSEIALMAVTVGVLTDFFISHYIFRWRTAMNEFYMANWQKLRRIEGAAQRVQDDTMRFSTGAEDLGASLITSIMTLIAFLPVLVILSAHVKALPLVGNIAYPLVVAAVVWSAFGTGFLALIGVKLPGLQFRNQKVEAAYRKELVYGEDDPDRAQPPTVRELFSEVRKNYFRLYFNYAYFNIGRIIYLQSDIVFPYIVLAPTIVAGAITLGLLTQILNAFDQVRSSFQYLVNSWTSVIELISIYKRLRAFEAAVHSETVA